MLRSIRFRLTLWHAVLLAVFLALFSLVVYVAAGRAMHAEVDSELRREADEVAGQLRPELRGTHPAVRAMGDDLTETDLLAQVLDERGRIVEKSLTLHATVLPLPPGRVPAHTTFLTANRAGALLRLYFQPVRRAGRVVRVVEVAKPLTGVERAQQDLRRILGFGIPATLLLSFLGGLLLAHWTLSPIDRITRAARAVTADALSYRLRLDSTQDELGRLGVAFNDMVARLEQSFTTQQRFVADASHELRTPLTIMAGHLDVCLRDPTATEQLRRQTLAVLREEVAHLNRTVEALLLLARADAGEGLPVTEPVELDLLVERAVEEARALVAGRQFRVTHVEPLVVKGSADLLRQLLGNLIDNAVRYTPSSGRIEAALRREGAQAVITIADEGPGIAPEHQPHLFERFYRVDKARSRELGGAGLGLAICRWIADSHGGTISVESCLGQGSTFSVALPLSTTSRPGFSHQILMRT